LKKETELYLVNIYMFQFTNYIDPLAFFIAFAVGLFFVYIYAPKKKIVIQWPTPENAGKIVYREKDDSCYTYMVNEVPCNK
jgi:hypothetical protein